MQFAVFIIFHKEEVPLRPIVSYVGQVLYRIAKYLANILSPFSRQFSSFVENSSYLCEILSNVSIEEDEILVSFDVKSLYTSVPVQPPLKSVESLLMAESSWKKRQLSQSKTVWIFSPPA